MKKLFSLLAIFLFAISAHSIAFEGNPNWSINFSSSKVFVENQGQFQLPAECGTQKVLYAFDNGASMIYFTSLGVTFSFKKIIEKEGEKNSASELEKDKKEFEKVDAEFWNEKEKKEKQVDFETDAVNMTWQNANPNVEVIAGDRANEYFNYTFHQNGKTKDLNQIPAFKKIIYKNLYPGIDVEYVFHPQEGIKYSIIIHPGADASLIQMKYSGNKKLLLQNGDLKITTAFGDITDHAPQSFFAADNSPISSSFTKNQNTVSFALNNYDHTKEIIIDPWTVNPAMPNSQKVWEIESDSAGNAYIYGGDWPNCKLQKYNLAGVLQWTNTTAGYDSSSWIGTLATDLVGNSYVTIGSTAAIKKVSAAGVTQWNANGGLLDEYWSLAFNCDYTKLICGGTRLTGLIPTGNGRAFDINMTNGSVISSVVVAHSIPSFIIGDVNEIRSICSSPNGNFYFHTLDTIGALTTSLGINWRLLTSYSYAYSSPSYGFTPQPQHVIRATSNYIYTMNGQTIFRRDISTGAVINQAAIPSGSYTDPLFVQGIAPNNNGIAIDSCGNVYVGSTNKIVKYDAALNLLSSVTTAGVVYDVAIGKNGQVLVCGNGYASSISMSACPQSKKISCYSLGTSPVSAFTISDNTICPGSCITFNDQSTNTPTSWSWTFVGGNPSSSTSQNPGTVCFAAAGSYTVTLTATNSSGSNSSSQTVTVYNTPSPGAGGDVAICAGASTTLGASGGTTYLWSPTTGLNNATSASPIASPTASTTYIVVATNTEGCTGSDAVIVTVNPLPSVTVTPPTYSLCKGQGIQLTANGASTYSWSPSTGLSGTSGSAVFANPNNSTTYTVTGTNSFGCTASVTAGITVQDQPFVIAGITNDSPCPGSGAIALTIIGTPPYLFNWNTGATTQNISNLVAGNYTVTVTAGPCTVVTTYTVSPGTYNPTLIVSNLYSCSSRLNWTATPTASYYKVRYKISGTSTWSAAVNVGAALFYDFTGLASNTLYNFQVAAFCASNQNLGWKVKNGKTQICTAPINPTVTALTNISATISWTTACSPLNFLLQYRKTGTTAWTNITTTNSYATINNLVNATEYEYRVRSNCGTGINSAFTALTTFTTAPRLEDTEVENTFHLFPNPNTGSFTLQIPSLKIESQISIYNITGQLIYHSDLAATENASSLTVTLDNVADGLYEVVLNNSEQTVTQRLIIQK
ncbi:MAG: fibronectin type III domain-containing protein [Bacteroidota bacterium]